MGKIIGYIGTRRRSNATAGTGDVTAASNLTNEYLTRGDGGAKGIQTSAILCDDDGNISGINSLTVTTLYTLNILSTGDNIIILNDDVEAEPSQDAGLQVERGTETNASLIWDETDDVWKAGLDGSEVELSLLGHTHTGVYEPADADIQSHLSDTDNPHSVTASQVSAAPAALVEVISGHIVAPEASTIVLDQSAAYAYSINSLIGVCTAGSVDIDIQIDGTPVTSIDGVTVDDSEDTHTATGASSVSVGSTVSLVINSESSAENFSFSLKTTRT